MPHAVWNATARHWATHAFPSYNAALAWLNRSAERGWRGWLLDNGVQPDEYIILPAEGH